MYVCTHMHMHLNSVRLTQAQPIYTLCTYVEYIRGVGFGDGVVMVLEMV